MARDYYRTSGVQGNARPISDGVPGDILMKVIVR